MFKTPLTTETRPHPQTVGYLYSFTGLDSQDVKQMLRLIGQYEGIMANGGRLNKAQATCLLFYWWMVTQDFGFRTARLQAITESMWPAFELFAAMPNGKVQRIVILDGRFVAVADMDVRFYDSETDTWILRLPYHVLTAVTVDLHVLWMRHWNTPQPETAADAAITNETNATGLPDGPHNADHAPAPAAG